MRDGLQSRIEFVCKAQANVRQVRLEYESETSINRTDRLDKFVAMRRDVIRTVMNEFVCYFSDQLYNCKIVYDDNHLDHFGRKMFRAGITLRIYKGANLSDDLKVVPHYSVLWDDVNSVVRYHRSNVTKHVAGEAGFDGRSDIHEVTADLIESKLLSFTRWLFDEKPAH